MAVEDHVKQHISLPSFSYLDEAEGWVTKQECIAEQAGYYTYTIYEVRIVDTTQRERAKNDDGMLETTTA